MDSIDKLPLVLHALALDRAAPDGGYVGDKAKAFREGYGVACQHIAKELLLHPLVNLAANSITQTEAKAANPAEAVENDTMCA